MDDMVITFLIWDLKVAVVLAAVLAMVVVLQGAYRFVAARLGSVVREQVSVVRVPAPRHAAAPVGSRR